eukprot:Opistho-2@21274
MREAFPSIEDYGELVFTNDVMTRLFEPVIQGILNAIEVQLNRVTPPRKCDHLVLVGGFMSSLYLQRRIRDRFGNISAFKSSGKMGITAPADPGVAVLAGAVAYGLSQHRQLARHAPSYSPVSVLDKCMPATNGFHMTPVDVAAFKTQVLNCAESLRKCVDDCDSFVETVGLDEPSAWATEATTQRDHLFTSPSTA